MYIDWFTWGIWFLGLVILIVWIIVPIREFKQLVKKHHQQISSRQKENENGGP